MWLTGTAGEWSMYGYQSGTTDTEYLMNQNYRVRHSVVIGQRLLCLIYLYNYPNWVLGGCFFAVIG